MTFRRSATWQTSAGQRADHDGRRRVDVARRRGDRREPRHGAGDPTEHGGVPVLDPLDDEPHDHGRRRRDLGVDEGLGGHPVGLQSVAGVEPEPSEPEDAGPEDDERDRVRQRRMIRPDAAPTENDQQRQRRRPGRGVDHHAAGPVLRPARGQPTRRRPEPVGDRRVDQDRPQRQEHRPAQRPAAGSRRHPSPGRGDDREHHLVGHEGQRGDRDRRADGVQCRRRSQPEVSQTEVFRSPTRPFPVSFPNARL